MLLRQFDPQLNDIDPNSRDASALQVPDLWGEEFDSYLHVLEMVESAISGLLNELG